MEVDERWKAYLHPDHYNCPLHALGYSVTKRLSLYLDQEVEDTNENNVFPDFGGLAELIGFDPLEIQGFERAEQKGKAVLEEWKRREDLNPTVGNLVNYLLIMGREDILTDLQKPMQACATAFLSKEENFVKKGKPIQDETVSSSPGCGEEPKFITVQDVRTGKQTCYDAFVCYNPSGNSMRDLDFVREMISRLEAPPYNLRLFVPHRDDLYGITENNITAKIISERCRHMIVILSHNFLESEALEFQAAFAFSLSPAARVRRMVPVRLDDCPTPNIMRTMAMCDFTKRELWDWSWTRLAYSITIPLTEEDFKLQPSRSSEGMSERNFSSDYDSGMESMPSGSSTGAVGGRHSPAAQPHTAPVHGTRPGPSTSSASAVQRPFTENFIKYQDSPKPAPKLSPKPSGSQTSGRARSPINSRQGSGSNLGTTSSKSFLPWKRNKKPVHS